jgi:hypothetical protein
LLVCQLRKHEANPSGGAEVTRYGGREKPSRYDVSAGLGEKPRIHTVRQLTAAAGDGRLGSVGSPGQLETSL